MQWSTGQSRQARPSIGPLTASQIRACCNLASRGSFRDVTLRFLTMGTTKRELNFPSNNVCSFPPEANESRALLVSIISTQADAKRKDGRLFCTVGSAKDVVSALSKLPLSLLQGYISTNGTRTAPERADVVDVLRGSISCLMKIVGVTVFLRTGSSAESYSIELSIAEVAPLSRGNKSSHPGQAGSRRHAFGLL